MSADAFVAAALAALLTGVAWYRAERRWRARVARLERDLARPQPSGAEALTGVLTTRSLFLQLDAELARARRAGSTLAVVAVDLDGSAVADRLLQSAASRFRDELREYDHLGRMGADRFVVILPGATPDHIASVLPRLAACVGAACAEVGCDAYASLGSAMFPEHGPDAEQLLVKADAEMFRMKRQKRTCGADPQVRAGPPGPALRPTGASAADQGVRPTC